MSGVPYIRFFGDDWLSGTQELSLEERGALITIVAITSSMGGGIALDYARLSRRFGCTQAKAKKIITALCEMGKLVIEDDTIINRRAQKETEIAQKTSKKQSETARSRWSKKSGKAKEIKEGVDAAALPRHCQPEPEPEPERAKSSPSSPERPARAPAAAGAIAEKGAALDDPTLRELILTACGADPVSGLVGPGGVMLGSRADMHTVDRWRCDLGLPDEVIVAVVRDTMDRKRDGPPSRLSYFDRPMQAEAAARNKPKLEPNNEPAFRRSNLGASGLSARTGADGFPPGLVGVAMRRAAARRAQIEGKV